MSQRRTHSIDMLSGPLLGRIIRFALPLAAASVLQQLFNAADIAVVGRFASAHSMAAVGGNAQVISLFVTLFNGLSIGANVVIARMIGGSRREEIPTAVRTTVITALICGLALAAAGTVVASPILRLISTPTEVLPLATVYLRIYFYGMPFILLYNFGSAVLRSKGDSRRPLYCLLLGGVVNVGLNVLFVAVWHMDVVGVALATVLSNALSAALVLAMLLREDDTFRLRFGRPWIRGAILRQIVIVGVPAGLQGVVFSLSNVLIQSVINGFGPDCAAGSAAAQNFEYMSYYCVASFASAAMTFTSQNWAAGQRERCRRVFWLTLAAVTAVSAAVDAAFILARRPIMALFSDDQTVVSFAMTRLLFVCSVNFLTGFYDVPAGCLRGMGRSVTPTVLTMMGSVVFRILWLWLVMPRWHEFWVLMLCYPVSWVLTSAGMLAALWLHWRRTKAAAPA